MNFGKHQYIIFITYEDRSLRLRSIFDLIKYLLQYAHDENRKYENEKIWDKCQRDCTPTTRKTEVKRVLVDTDAPARQTGSR